MKIVVVGAGGHGRVVLDILRNNHQFEVAGFLDSNMALHGQTVDGVPILGNIAMAQQLMQKGIGGAIVAIGDNRIRDQFAHNLHKCGIPLVNAIHPSANIAGNASIGKNVVIASGVNICTHVKIEDSVIINTGAIIDHESLVRRAAHICPGVRLAGHVIIKESAFVGIGATIIQGISINEYAIVGAGAVVLEDVDAYTTVVGVPARVIKSSHLQELKRKEIVQPSTAELEPAKLMITTRPQRKKLIQQRESVQDKKLEEIFGQ